MPRIIEVCKVMPRWQLSEKCNGGFRFAKRGQIGGSCTGYFLPPPRKSLIYKGSRQGLSERVHTPWTKGI